MHHKTKDTVRKRGRRIDHKSARAKTKRALEGTPVRTVARGDSWGVTMPQPPILDVPSTKGKPRRKPRPKKQSFHSKCRGGHEWYEEVVESDEYIRPCPHEIERRGRYKYHWDARRDGCDCETGIGIFGLDQHPRVWFKAYKRIKTCINCWEVRTLEEWDENPLPYKPVRYAYSKSWLNRWGPKPRQAYRKPKARPNV